MAGDLDTLYVLGNAEQTRARNAGRSGGGATDRSRPIVREALKSLQVQGLVEVINARGIACVT